MEVKEIFKMKEIIEILNKIEFCKKNTYNEKTLSFLNSIKEQYKEKDLIYDEMLGFSLDN